MGWAGFAAVFAGFFVTHSVPVRPGAKERLVSLLGPRGFGLACSALSLAMLALLIRAAGAAPLSAALVSGGLAPARGASGHVGGVPDPGVFHRAAPLPQPLSWRSASRRCWRASLPSPR